MNMSKNVVIPVILFVFVICICNPKVLANEEGYKFGEKLPMTPFVVLENENSVCRCVSWNARPTVSFTQYVFSGRKSNLIIENIG